MTGSERDATDDAARRRRERRDWIRHHHPDVGGDPAVFARGLARIDRTGTVSAVSAAAERITVVRSRSPWSRTRRLVRRVVKRQPPRRLL